MLYSVAFKCTQILMQNMPDLLNLIAALPRDLPVPYGQVPAPHHADTSAPAPPGADGTG